MSSPWMGRLVLALETHWHILIYIKVRQVFVFVQDLFPQTVLKVCSELKKKKSI